jgi:DNA polymerase elongation subunit (family B)
MCTGDWVEDHTGAITAISLKDSRSNKYFVMSTKMWSAKDSHLAGKTKVDLSRVHFKFCKNEEAIFKHLRAVLHLEKPDMLIGFYSQMFDFPYIIKRGTYVMGKEFMKGFSPWKRVTCKKMTDKTTGEIYDYFNEIQGIPLMDYQRMYKKFIYKPRESYSLDYLSTEELGESKLDYSDYDNLDDLWEKDPQLYIDYNIQDVELMDLMDKKLDLINTVLVTAYYAKVNYTDTLGTIGKWDSIFYHKLNEKNVMIPPKHGAVKERYAGAYVYEPEKKIHNWLIAVDLKSLYPHIQQEWNISPESLVADRRDEWGIDITEGLDDRYLDQKIPTPTDSIMAMNGCYFSKKEGIIPGLLRGIYADRDIAKKKMLDWEQKLQQWKEAKGIDNKQEFNKYDGPGRDEWEEMAKKISKYDNYQMAMKILMNSEYGALANVHFRYYDIRFASAITLCAQMALKWAAKALQEDPAREKYKYSIIYGDTDSLYISVENVVNQIKMRRPDITDAELVTQVNGFEKKIIQPILDAGYDALAKYVNANENRMFMNHEKTITNALWVGKKHYALNVLWDEGVTYAKPKLKVKGIALVKSSTPKVIRADLKESVAILLGDESKLPDFVKGVKAKYKSYLPADIAKAISANNIEKFLIEKPDGSLSYGLKTPIGVRAAIVYNNAIRNQKGMPVIKSGEKLKFVYLTKPNIYDENVIGFVRRVPEDAIKYIDWDMMFEKSFMSVITNIYMKMGKVFKLHDEVNLLDVF